MGSDAQPQSSQAHGAGRAGARPDETAPMQPVSRYQTPEEALHAEEATRRRTSEPGFVRFFLLLNLGLILTAISIVIFKAPNHFAFGGTSGVSLILNTLVPQLPVSVFMWILNGVLVVLGLIFLKPKVVGWSIYASLALSAYTSLTELVYPSGVSPTGDMWLDLCMAVILPAVGSAIVFDIGASTVGTDIIALILKERTSLKIGKALLIVDISIVVVAAFLYGPRAGLYCVLGLFAKTMVVDSAIESLHLRKVCTVICACPERVEEFIVRELDRTATITLGYGAYSGRRVVILMSVLSRREAVRLRQFVREADPGAFITIVSSSEIIGRGFRGV
ncbi:MAG: YitT family protein [Coriobacteriia bacterium]|nr:YitT family protein [Coriobacteriia bacterium]